MLCGTCSKSVSDGSDFCPFCGSALKEQGSCAQEAEILPNAAQSPLDDYYKKLAKKTANPAFQTLTRRACYTALVIFLFLFIKMAPGYGGYKFLAYIIGAAMAIGMVLLYDKQSKKSSSVIFYNGSLALALVVTLLCIGIRITYEAKVDLAMADIPSAGIVNVRLDYSDEYYSNSNIGGRMVYGSKVHVYINGELVKDNTVCQIDMGSETEIICSSEYHTNGVRYSGNGTRFVTIRPDHLENEYTFDIEFDTGAYHTCVVSVSFKYALSFWDVVLH